MTSETEKAIVPFLSAEYFGHISGDYRGKVARDLSSYIKANRTWDFNKFNPLNDYQRHLYALFLKLADIPYQKIQTTLFILSQDVSLKQRQRYIDDILHSEIVGFPLKNGSTLPFIGIAN